MPKRAKRPMFRDGKVHVCKRMCATCIFHPGNIMTLREGRLESMVAAATKEESAIICHQTLGEGEAACRGFFDKHKTSSLQIAERLGYIQFQDFKGAPTK
jgi:hypothetical protein